MNSSHSKERIKCQTYKVERNKSEKEELINPQIDKSNRENINNEDIPVYNYPYEFYDDEKMKKEEINIQNNKEEEKIKQEEKEVKNNEEKKINNENKKIEIKVDEDTKKLEQKGIIKELFQKLGGVPENAQKDFEIKNQQINRNERGLNIEENKIIKNEEINVNKEQKKEEKKVKQIVLKNMDKIQLKNPIIPREEYKVPKVKEIKLEKEIIPEKKGTNQLHKSKFTQKTENDYNLMMKQLKNKNYKNNEEHVIKKLISADDKILSKENNNKPKRKELINDFLQRNQDYIEYKQNIDKTINERLKIANENIKNRIYFDNKENEQKYFEEFYNNQIQFMNNCQTNLDKLTQQINEENEKKYIPEPKNKTNLNYFKNKNSVELSKYISLTNP